MRLRELLVGFGAALALTGAPVAAGVGPDPLFTTHTPIDLRLDAPFATMVRERDKSKRYEARLRFDDGDRQRSVPATLEARGNHRLKKSVCRFIPLRVLFASSDVEGTPFEKQKKLKLVTVCKPENTRYQQYVFSEYLIYRMFNVLSDYSFGVRLTNISFHDLSDPESKPIDSFGFFIEDKKRLAKRFGMKNIDHHRVNPSDHRLDQLSLVGLFQYLIGNTDWSALEGEQDEPCCHNSKLIGETGGKYIAVPYDFDFAGLVNAEYAIPTAGLGQRNVRIRVYRGFCRAGAHLETNLELLRSRKAAIYELFDAPQLNERTTKRSIRYLDQFYELIDHPKRIKRHIIDRCRG